MDDLFEKIASGEIPSIKIYEDEHTFAFLDNLPVHNGHTLVIPKKKYRNILDIPEDEMVHIARTIKKVAPAVKEATGADGLNINSNHEAAAGQKVFHIHFHIIPRFENDGLEMWGKEDPYMEGEGEAVAEKIKQHLQS